MEATARWRIGLGGKRPTGRGRGVAGGKASGFALAVALSLVGGRATADSREAAAWAGSTAGGAWPWVASILGGLLFAFCAWLIVRSRRRAETAVQRMERTNEALLGLTHLARDCRRSEDFFLAATRLAAEALGVRFATIWQCFEQSDTLFVRPLVYDAEAGRHRRPDVRVDATQYPQWIAAMRRDHEVRANDAATDHRTRDVYQDFLAFLGPLAEIDVVIQTRGRWRGMVTVQATGKHRGWTPEDALVARQLADLAGLRLEEDARLCAEAVVAQRAERLQATNQALRVASRLVAQLEVDEMGSARELTKRCCQALDVSRVALWRCVPDSSLVRIVAMYDGLQDSFVQPLQLDSLQYTEYWQALVKDGRVMTGMGRQDPRTRKLCEVLLPSTGQVAFLDVAIVVNRQVVGLFSCHLANSERSWTAEDEILVASLVDTLALHFERTERRREELTRQARAAAVARHAEGLATISKVVAGQPQPDVAAVELARISAQSLQLTAVSFWLEPADETTDYRLKARYWRESGKVEQGAVLPQVLAAAYRRRIETERVVAIVDGEADPSYAAIHAVLFPPGFKVALLAAAVRFRAEPVGVLIFRQEGCVRQWTVEEEVFAGAVADAMSLVLEADARLRYERELLSRNAVLQKATHALASLATSEAVRGGEISVAFRQLAQLGAETLGVARASCWRVVVEDGSLVLEDEYLHRDRSHRGGDSVALSALDSYWQQLRTGQNLQVRCTSDSPIYRRFVEACGGIGASAVLHVPISADGGPLGVLCFEQLEGSRTWSQEEVLFANSCADLASLIWERSARRAAELAQEASGRRLQSLIDGTPLAAIDWDVKGTIVGWNPAAERIFGYRAQEVLAREGSFLFAEGHPAVLAGVLEQRFSGRPAYAERLSNQRKNGQRILCDWRTTVLRSATGEVLGVASLVEDVTERVAIENEVRALNCGLEVRVEERTAELESANTKLRELDRLKTEFLATMSHELRTPLNSIIGFSGLLAAELAGPINEEQTVQLGMVSQSAKHLLRLITDLLDVSRIEAGRLRFERGQFSPAKVAVQVRDTLLPLAQQKGLELRVVNQLVGVQWESDKNRIFQIFLNLANNAVKFTEAGNIELKLFESDGAQVFQVSDTGMGIAPDRISWLFEAFRQLDGSSQRQHEGTGLGLYLSRKLARLLGGDITVDSEAGVGSTFAVAFPREIATVPKASPGHSTEMDCSL